MAEVLSLSERDFITAVKYSNDDNYLAVADNAKNVKCYKVEWNEQLSSYTNVTRDLWQHHAGRITALSWSPSSSYLATCGVDTLCLVYSPTKISQNIQIKSKRLILTTFIRLYIEFRYL